MADDFEILDALPAGNSRGHGGARKGAGRKPKDHVPSKDKTDFDAARARNEAAKADMAELEYQIKSGQYVSRDAVKQACATAFASLAQGLRTIPDNLERKLGLGGEACEAVGEIIDEALANLSGEFELMTGSQE
jgi:hypothetical protein